jgi:hypothetical protein
MTVTSRSVAASKLKRGQWLVGNNPRASQRIVDVDTTADGRIRVEVDYGNGGEPGVMFFDKDERLLVA